MPYYDLNIEFDEVDTKERIVMDHTVFTENIAKEITYLGRCGIKVNKYSENKNKKDDYHWDKYLGEIKC